MPENIHNLTLKQMLALGIGTTIHFSLLNGYTDDPDHDFMSSLSAFEIATTTGYTQGYAAGVAGRTLDGVVFAQDNPNNWATMDATDEVIANIGVPAGVAIGHLALWLPGTSYADARVIRAYPAAQTLNGGNLTLQFNAVGLVKLTG